MKAKHRFIENGPVVVDIATASFRDALSGRKVAIQVKAKARVNTESGDVYDPKKGRELAKRRANLKLAKKMQTIAAGFNKYVNNILDSQKKVLEDQVAQYETQLNEFIATI